MDGSNQKVESSSTSVAKEVIVTDSGNDHHHRITGHFLENEWETLLFFVFFLPQCQIWYKLSLFMVFPSEAV